MDNKNYNWEEFEPTKGRFTPFITIVETGGIGISAGFIKKYAIKDGSTVKLFLDKEKPSIGISFSDEKSLNSITLKISKFGGAHINAKPFWIRFDIPHMKYVGKYTPKEVVVNENKKIYVIDLKDNPEYIPF